MLIDVQNTRCRYYTEYAPRDSDDDSHRGQPEAHLAKVLESGHRDVPHAIEADRARRRAQQPAAGRQRPRLELSSAGMAL